MCIRDSNRTTRSVAPSASGERLYARIAPLFEELAVAVAETCEATGRVNGTLRINCLLYTSDAADELDGVDLGGRRIIKKKKR